MLRMAKDYKYLKVFDEDGNLIDFVHGYDADLGYILVYNDLKWNKEEKRFILKSLKPKRIYLKFTYNALPPGK